MDTIQQVQSHKDAQRTDHGLCVAHVTVAYRNGHIAMKDASFEVPRSSICALVGINGSGKSTLFKAIMGFVPIAKGDISIFDMPMVEARKAGKVAYVPQSEDVDWTFPVLVEDVVMMGRFGHMGWLRRAKPADKEAVDAALERVGLKNLRKRQIGELSGGQKKRAFLARALAQGGEILLLDEPFTGVDVTTEAEIIALLADLRDEGKIILISTHNLGSVPEFCDRAVLIKGTILASGKTADVFNSDNLAIAFGGALRSYTLGGSDLHDDDDTRSITVLTDDERPFVIYDKDGDKPNS